MSKLRRASMLLVVLILGTLLAGAAATLILIGAATLLDGNPLNNFLRREVTFVRFPDENHELSRSGKPRHRLERFRIILDWFAKYLPTA